MIYQTSINFDGRTQRLFISLEDYAKIAPNDYHTHKFDEFIFLDAGTIAFEIDGKRYDLQAGSLLAIPSGALHRCIERSDDLDFFYMMSDSFVPQTVMSECDTGVLKEVIGLSRNLDQKNVFKLRVLVMFLCYDLFQQKNFEVSQNVDYDFYIDRCINVDTTIEQLADMLGVSTRHARRLVIQCTGKSFKQYRLDLRMGMAKNMLENGTESPVVIAKRVGYGSYKGFRKAYKKFYGDT